MPRQRQDVPWLTWRDNGVAYANWYDGARTHRKSLDTRDPVEAAKRFGRFLIEGPTDPRRDAGLTVNAALDDYDREHVRPNVVDKVRQENIFVHLRGYFGDTLLKGIGPLESRAYADARRQGLVGGGKRRKDRRGSDSTIRRELNCLVAAANHAVKWGRLPVGDMPRVELPAETTREEVKWLTKEQLREALEAATGDLHDFIQIAYYTAARKRSIERLTKFQVDLQNGRINLRPPGSQATKKRRPVVPLYPEIRPIVERRIAASNNEWLFAPNADFYRPFVKLLAKKDIEAHPHMLRHSRATHMLMDGEDIYKVAKLLGDTVATVERVYGHFSPEFLATKSSVA